MNIAATGFEWLSAPLLLFTRTNQFLFLINWASYLMLPGLIFSVFTRLQVRPRVAWWWMWLLASGWCYVLQASSDMNDSFAVIYALASVDFALRAQEKKFHHGPLVFRADDGRVVDGNKTDHSSARPACG